jgi:hypothetical protein
MDWGIYARDDPHFGGLMNLGDTSQGRHIVRSRRLRDARAGPSADPKCEIYPAAAGTLAGQAPTGPPVQNLRRTDRPIPAEATFKSGPKKHEH